MYQASPFRLTPQPAIQKLLEMPFHFNDDQLQGRVEEIQAQKRGPDLKPSVAPTQRPDSTIHALVKENEVAAVQVLGFAVLFFAEKREREHSPRTPFQMPHGICRDRLRSADSPRSCKALLLKRKAAAQDRDSLNRTALHVAASEGYIDLTTALLEAGADPNARDRAQWTPLVSAACSGHLAACSLLVAVAGA